MNSIQIQEQEEDFHIERASKWTVYFLIDLRVVFIISYVYISVIYLISTTANSEANADVNSMQLFNITSQPNHTNVIVSHIDDALLWSCRNLSVTKSYYKGLYAMLFTAFTVIMIFLVITKLTILFGNRTDFVFSRLWKIAAVQHLQDVIPKIQHPPLIVRDHNNVRNVRNPARNHNNESEDPDIDVAEKCLDLLKKYESKKFHIHTDNKSINEDSENQKVVSVIQQFNWCRLGTLFISVILTLIIIPLAFMSYDLHALSCLVETSDEYIDYDSLTHTVELRYSDNMLLFRKTIIGFIILFSLLFLLNAGCFYLSNSIIINHMKLLVKKHAYRNGLHAI